VTESLAPAAGGLNLLHHSPDLTVINVAWAPHMQLMPHDHRMWAVIGIYAGVEDNQFFRRDANGELVETTSRRLDGGDVCMLGTDTVTRSRTPATVSPARCTCTAETSSTNPAANGVPATSSENAPWDLAEVNRQFHDANVAAGLA